MTDGDPVQYTIFLQRYLQTLSTTFKDLVEVYTDGTDQRGREGMRTDPKNTGKGRNKEVQLHPLVD